MEDLSSRRRFCEVAGLEEEKEESFSTVSFEEKEKEDNKKNLEKASLAEVFSPLQSINSPNVTPRIITAVDTDFIFVDGMVVAGVVS